jgi:uncharacterized membrane protein
MYAQKAVVQKTKIPDWAIIVALLLLSAFPALNSVLRLTSLASGEVTPANARFFAAPVPVIVHVISVTVYCILGAFQFASGWRTRHLELHRLMGRFLLVAGLLSALSGLWMTVLYPLFPSLQGVILYAARMVVGTAMTVALVLAFMTIRRGNVGAHKAWMIRAYAYGQGAGTQVLIFIPWMVAFGAPNDLTRDLLMTLAWTINAIFAEWVIQRRLI